MGTVLSAEIKSTPLLPIGLEVGGRHKKSWTPWTRLGILSDASPIWGPMARSEPKRDTFALPEYNSRVLIISVAENGSAQKFH